MRFTIYNDGFVRYNKPDTAAVLSDLKLRISRGSNTPKLLDTYGFRETFSAHETCSVRIFTEHSSTGSWTELQEGEVVYVNGKPYSAGGSSNSANLSASGNTFTTSFDNSGSKGTLK